ncbi:hypothetical protein JW905_13510, partial [bacterium]|nr:hypothetical protein [candidate division CSSED10-310 bacterium]
WVAGAMEGTLFRYADESVGYSRGFMIRLKSSSLHSLRRLPGFAYDKWRQLICLLAVPPALVLLLCAVSGMYIRRKLHELLRPDPY